MSRHIGPAPESYLKNVGKHENIAYRNGTQLDETLQQRPFHPLRAPPQRLRGHPFNHSRRLRGSQIRQ